MTDYFLVTKEELDQIKNDCLYPLRESCDGCDCAEDIDGSRASGVGCSFIGANALMDKVMKRKLSNALKAEGARMITAITNELNDVDRYWKGMHKSIKIIKSLTKGVKHEG